MTSSRMPARMIAGDSLTLSIPAGGHPASDGWSVALTLTPIKGGTPVTAAGSADGSAWIMVLNSVASAGLAPATYRYLIAATKAGERTTIEYGQVEVQADPATGNADLRTAAQRALDAIDAVLEHRAGSENIEYVFEDGRSIKKVPHGELLQLRRHYARQVARETQGRRGPARVSVRL